MKEGTRGKKGGEAAEDFEGMMESLRRRLSTAGAQTLLLMLEEWKEMYLSA